MPARRDDRPDIVWIIPRNGAYLVSLALTEWTDDLTSDEMFDCASSWPRARTVGRQMAEQVGFTGPWRWVEHEGHTYLTLRGTPPPESEED